MLDNIRIQLYLVTIGLEHVDESPRGNVLRAFRKDGNDAKKIPPDAILCDQCCVSKKRNTR